MGCGVRHTLRARKRIAGPVTRRHPAEDLEIELSSAPPADAGPRGTLRPPVRQLLGGGFGPAPALGGAVGLPLPLRISVRHALPPPTDPKKPPRVCAPRTPAAPPGADSDRSMAKLPPHEVGEGWHSRRFSPIKAILPGEPADRRPHLRAVKPDATVGHLSSGDVRLQGTTMSCAHGSDQPQHLVPGAARTFFAPATEIVADEAQSHAHGGGPSRRPSPTNGVAVTDQIPDGILFGVRFNPSSMDRTDQPDRQRPRPRRVVVVDLR